MTIVSEAILDRFEMSGWARAHAWVNYTAITKVTNEFLKVRGCTPKKGSTIERIVRFLVKEGRLEADGRGNFRMVN